MLGSGLGLGLGATFLAIMAGGADTGRADALAEAAARGYSGSYLEAEGKGLRMGLERYGYRDEYEIAAEKVRLADIRRRAKIQRRADLQCLTEAVYYEARSESPRGQSAVATVVLNRVKHPAYPKTVCGVVFQGAGHPGCQFSFACDGSMRARREVLAWNRAKSVATRALSGVALAQVGSATHYHTTAVAPYWAPHMLRVANVGVHVFYRFNPNRPRLAPAAGMIQQAVLTSGSAGNIPELRLEPAIVEQAVEASLQPAVSTEKAKPDQAAPVGKPSDAAALTALPAVSAGGS